MASIFQGIKIYITIIIAISFSMQITAFGNNNNNSIACENLNKDSCSYAVSSTGNRCVLEKKHVRRIGEEVYTCRSSDIKAADKLKDWIETEECVESCGVDKHALGISSDSLLESSFTTKLCSPNCYITCPNIVDLYFNLAAGEGVYLPKLCEEVRGANARRGMAEIKSSGGIIINVAPGPESSGGVETLSIPPTMSPM